MSTTFAHQYMQACRVELEKAICEAILKRRVLGFEYAEHQRLVRPCVHGWSESGNGLLLAQELEPADGRRVAWKTFRIDMMVAIEVVDAPMVLGDRVYRDLPTGMTRIHCELPVGFGPM